MRLFIIGSRLPVLPSFPAPTHSGANDIFRIASWRTLEDFLQTMPVPTQDEVVRPTAALWKQLQTLPPGSGLKSAGVREATRPGGHWGYRQGTFIADPRKPARTVTAASTQDWIRLEDGSLRRLTLRECAGLQGFPTEWEFTGTTSSRFRQVGNAVPALFGEVIGKVLREVAISFDRGTFTDDVRPPSPALPSKFFEYVSYTARDEARNGGTRPRSKYRVRV
jgi:Site-specific DNA methylase